MSVKVRSRVGDGQEMEMEGMKEKKEMMQKKEMK